MGWRHTHYAHGLIAMVLLIASAGLSHGQWATNAWPSWDWPRAGKTQAQDCWNAVNERVRFLNPYNDELSISDWNSAAPAWYRSQRGNLESQKEKLWEYFVNLDWYSDNTISNLLHGTIKIYHINPDLEEWADIESFIDASDPDNVWVPGALWTQICDHARLPTNYLLYTPYRCLNGAGPFTNDASVGHPHGWTNVQTQAGGNYYPSGRSAWYTTDYGWAGLTSLICQIQVFHVLGATENKTHDFGEARGRTNWATAKSDAEAGWYSHGWQSGSADIWDIRPWQASIGSFNSDTSLWTGQLYAELWSSEFKIYTNQPIEWAKYVFYTRNFTTSAIRTSVFDDNGLGYGNSAWNYMDLPSYTTNSGTNLVLWYVIGQTNIPNWVDEPTVPSILHYRGWEALRPYSYRAGFVKPAFLYK